MKKASILIVEDECIIAMEIESQLQRLGYEVTSIVNTGEKVLEKVGIDKPDLILMDIRIKGEMDGIETAEIIRSQYGIPIIFSTAYLDEERIGRAKISMPFGYVLKPIQERDLKVTVEMALYVSKIDRERRQAETTLKKSDRQLKSRVKELECFYAISELLETPELSLDDILSGIVELLHRGWQYTKFAHARLVFNDGKKILCPHGDLPIEEKLSLSANIKAYNKTVGTLVVFYELGFEKYSDDVFTKEEKSLLAAIAERVGKTIELKQAKEKLVTSEKHLRQLVDNLLIGVLMVNGNHITYQNPECVRIVGDLQQSEFQKFYQNIIRKDRQIIEDSFNSLKDGTNSTITFQFKVLNETVDDNTHVEKYVQGLASFINYQEENTLFINLLDITKTHQLEKYISIQERMSSLGRISAGIAHEIRNPLTGINSYLFSLHSILNKDMINEDDLTLGKHVVSQIQSASQKIESVIKHVIDFTKAGAPNIIFADINKSIKDAVELSAVALSKAKITLDLKLADAPQICLIDPLQIEQVVLNLINNAEKALKDNDEDKKITISTQSLMNEMLIEVADSGHGVRPEIKHKIFDPFFSTSKDGSGIGLSIVQRIITDHGGSIKLMAKKQRGATFHIKLPIKKRETVG